MNQAAKKVWKPFGSLPFLYRQVAHRYLLLRRFGSAEALAKEKRAKSLDGHLTDVL